MGIAGAIIGSSVIGAIGSSKAASAQKDAAASQAAVARETRDLTRADLKPYYDSGTLAQNALLSEMGLGPAPMVGGELPQIETISGRSGPRRMGDFPLRSRSRDTYSVGGQSFNTMDEAQAYAEANRTGGTPYGGFTATPGYDFRLQQGVNALDASAAGSGMLRSGATAQALTQFGQDYGSQEYGNYYNRLAGIAAGGQNAAAGMGAANMNAGNQQINALGNAGNAQAAGYVGMANAVNGGVNNYLGYQMMNKLLA